MPPFRCFFRAQSEESSVHSPRTLVYAALSYCVMMWALNTVLVKHLLGGIAPLAFTGMRFLIMTPLVVLLAVLRRERLFMHVRDLPLLIACAACGYGVYQYFWIVGLSYTTAFATALLSSLTPIFTFAIVAVARIERVRSGRWLGALVALVGVAIFEGAFSGHAAFRLGDALALGAAAIFAFYNVLSARLLDRYTPVALVAITMCIGTVMILPGAIPQMLHQNYAHLPLADWLIFGYAVLFPIVLTFPVWSWGISRLGAARTSIFQFAVPVLAGLLSIPLLHARIANYQIAGAVACIGGMAFSQALGRVSLTALWSERTLPLKR